MNKKHLLHAFLFAALLTMMLRMVMMYSANQDIAHWKALYWLLLDNSQVVARFAILYYIALNFSAWRSPDQISYRFTAAMAVFFMVAYFTARSIISLILAVPFYLSTPTHGELYSLWSSYSKLLMVISTQWVIPLLLLTLIIKLANYRQELKDDPFVERPAKSSAKLFWPATIVLAVVFFSGFANTILSQTERLKDLIFHTNGLFNQFIIGQADVFHGYTIFSCTSIITLIIASFLGLRQCNTRYFDAAPALYKTFICAAALMSLWLGTLIITANALQSAMALQINAAQVYTVYFQFFLLLWTLSALLVYGVCRLFTALSNRSSSKDTKKTLE